MYQLNIASPQKRAINVPITRNGAKGTSDFKVFLLRAMRPVPIKAPIRKEEKRAIKMFGQPRNSPKKKTNLTSPNPSQFPWEIKKIKRKKNKTRPAPKKAYKREPESKLTKPASEAFSN